MCGEDDPTPGINDEDVRANAPERGLDESRGYGDLQIVGGNANVEAFDMSFPQVFGLMQNVRHDGVSTTISDAWRKIQSDLELASTNFRTTMSGLLTNDDEKPWKGLSIQAAADNAKRSIDETDYIAKAAGRGGAMVDKYRETLNFVHDKLIADVVDSAHDDLLDHYHEQIGMDGDQCRAVPDAAQIVEQYNTYMRTIMNGAYRGGLEDIWLGYPRFTADATPTIGNAAPPPAGQDGPSSGPPSAGSATPPGTTDTEPATPSTPSTTSTPSTSQSTSQQQPGGADIGQALQPLSEAASAGMGAMSDAAQQAADAGKSALDSLTGLAGPGAQDAVPGLPEGVLSLGATPLSSDTNRGPSGTSRSPGGASAPSLARDAVTRNIAASTPAATSTTGSTAASSRAGLASGMSGAGAPVAGTRGGGADGKDHVPNKVLRRRQNGEVILTDSDADAVLPVLGADESTPEPQPPPPR